MQIWELRQQQVNHQHRNPHLIKLSPCARLNLINWINWSNLLNNEAWRKWYRCWIKQLLKKCFTAILVAIVPGKWYVGICGVAGEPNVFRGLWSNKVEGNLLWDSLTERDSNLGISQSATSKIPPRFPSISWQFTTILLKLKTSSVCFHPLCKRFSAVFRISLAWWHKSQKH